MSDELNPYPGNLKHHRVDPLLSDEQVMDARAWPPEEVRHYYEAARAKDAELIQRLVDAGDVMKQWLGLTLQMDGESCPDCGYDWGKGHNYGCAQLQHQKSIDEWDAAKTAGFKPSDR